ncbi:MAG TPA: methyltransferase, partial [Verrucomicrobiae bacterium]|nr:methyltransferase [Verrucomicrobiae bacterium]
MRDESADADLTRDELRDYGLHVLQERKGYRFSLDPLLLCEFCRMSPGMRVADLGTGCGVIPLVLAKREETAAFAGVELQGRMAELAERNVALNGLGDRVEIVHADILHLSSRFAAGSFDLVTANPPYRSPSSGKISPRAVRDAARHETTAGLAEFLDAAKRLVRTGGAICMIYHVSRLTELLCAAQQRKLAPLRLRFVHGSSQAAAR